MYPIYFKMIENQKNPDRQYFLRILFIRIFLYVLISDLQVMAWLFRSDYVFVFRHIGKLCLVAYGKLYQPFLRSAMAALRRIISLCCIGPLQTAGRAGFVSS